MVITAAGNVGIGTSTSSVDYTLEVTGTAGKSSGGTTWANSSDIRLKDIKGDYKMGLDEILKLRTVEFSYKKDNARNLPSDTDEVGFIAQEVQEVFPEAVSEGKDGYLDFNMHPINVAIINAVKELHEENSELKEELKLIKEYICKKDPSAAPCL
jgi:trimeric autotransporter adhesin